MVSSDPKRRAMSASAGNNLPPEITEAILRLLPVKSVGRFKSVSKTWNSLISNPQFIKTHLHHHMDRHQTRKLILYLYTGSLYSVGVNELLPYLNSDEIPATAKELIFRSPLIRWEEILGSCNGLVLAKDEGNAIFLMNPTTREMWNVPSSPFSLPVGGFDVMYGFGYDSTTDDYKVVSVAIWDPESQLVPDHTDTVVTVYSLRSNSWRRFSPNDHPAFRLTHGALVNQNYHWFVNSLMIVAFSLGYEKFNEIKLPDSFHNAEDGVFYAFMVDFGGKVGVFKGLLSGTCELWVMEEYGVGKSWTRVFSHEFKDPVSPGYLDEGSNRDIVLDDDFGACVRPVCLVEGSDRDIVLSHEGRVVVYNIDESRYRDVWIAGGPTYFFIGGSYVESLESPARFITAT